VDRWEIFSASKDIYQKQGIEVTTSDMQFLQIIFFKYSGIIVFHILEKSVVAKDCKFSLHALNFTGVSICNRVPGSRSIYSSLDLTKPKYSINNNNNSVQFVIIYVPSQQPQGQ
jgi:hypothetical protein